MSCLKVICWALIIYTHYRCIRFDIIICIIMTYSVYIIKNYHTGRGGGSVLAFDFDDLFVDFDEFQLPLRRISTRLRRISTRLRRICTRLWRFFLNFDEFGLKLWKWYLRSGNDMYMFVILSPLGKHNNQGFIFDLYTAAEN